MIRLDGVGKTFGDGTVAVEALDLDVPRGAVVTLVGSISRLTILSVVDFPHPDGPTRQTSSPRATSRSSSRTATVPSA